VKRFLAALLWVCPIPAHAVDGVSLELGHADEAVRMWRVGLQWKQEPRFLTDSDWRLYWEAAYGGWNSHGQAVHDFGLTPVFRYAPNENRYAEAAIGFHVLSDLHISTDLDFSTRFQFGSHLGAGVRFGSRHQYDFGVRVQHLSNGGIRNPNPGINFLLLRLQYHLR
jgi:lipid A 3-O-deacylase